MAVKKGAIQITFDTPTTSEMEEYVEKTLLSRIEKIRITGTTAAERDVLIAATLFQRLVSRTPLDENYEFEVEVNGVEFVEEHEADDDVARNDWIMYLTTKGGTYSIYSSDFDPSLFADVNDSDAIEDIAYQIEEELDGERIKNILFENHNKHIGVLEYGMYEWSYSREKIGDEYGYSHGVKNHFSYQAPAGMIRKTMFEFDLLLHEYFSEEWKGGRGVTKISRSTFKDFIITDDDFANMYNQGYESLRLDFDIG